MEILSSLPPDFSIPDPDRPADRASFIDGLADLAEHGESAPRACCRDGDRLEPVESCSLPAMPSDRRGAGAFGLIAPSRLVAGARRPRDVESMARSLGECHRVSYYRSGR